MHRVEMHRVRMQRVEMHRVQMHRVQKHRVQMHRVQVHRILDHVLQMCPIRSWSAVVLEHKENILINFDSLTSLVQKVMK